MVAIAKRTLEIRGSELPKKVRGKNVSPDTLLRVTIEIIEDTAPKKIRARDLIGAAKRLDEAPSGDGSTVEDDLRALREEWGK